MSSIINDYVASSNNSINENKYNAKKARSTIHQIKQLLQPVIALIKRSRNKKKYNTYRKQPQPEYYLDEDADADADAQNLANERLEARICEEINSCPEFAAVPVYTNGRVQVIPILRGQRFVPVHFARTNAGTFFWTSMSAADSDINMGDKHVITEHQTPESQAPCDRWAQA